MWDFAEQKTIGCLTMPGDGAEVWKLPDCGCERRHNITSKTVESWGSTLQSKRQLAAFIMPGNGAERWKSWLGMWEETQHYINDNSVESSGIWGSTLQYAVQYLDNLFPHLSCIKLGQQHWFFRSASKELEDILKLSVRKCKWTFNSTKDIWMM